MFTISFHLVIGLIGAVLLYVALFLRETEQGQIQNRLENLWVDIDDLSKSALSKQVAFLQEVSALANSGLDSLFGVRLFSAASISTSLSLSVGGASLLVAYAIWNMQTIFGNTTYLINHVGKPVLATGICS